MGYQKTQEVRIFRTKHKVTFSSSTTAADLKNMLSLVPNLATVDEVLVDYEKDISSIEFHEETVERQ